MDTLGSEVANHADKKRETKTRWKQGTVLFNLGISTHRIECNCRWDGKHGYEHGPNSHGRAREKQDDRRAIFTSNHELILCSAQLLQIDLERI